MNDFKNLKFRLALRQLSLISKFFSNKTPLISKEGCHIFSGPDLNNNADDTLKGDYHHSKAAFLRGGSHTVPKKEYY